MGFCSSLRRTKSTFLKSNIIITSKNYNFWWYEVENIKLIDPKKFTYEWADLKKTRKFRVLEILIDFHDEKENIYNLLNNALNIISALDDGINVNTEIPCFIEVFNMYYEGRKLKEKQLKLF